MANATHALLRAVALGVVAGMRSQLPLALLSLAAQKQGRNQQGLPGVLASPNVTALLVACAAGELVVDKLPITPSRLLPGSLIMRASIGAIAGTLLTRKSGPQPTCGAALGAVGALAGSVAGHDLRAGLVAATGLPDPLVALLEDVTAVAIGKHTVGLTGWPARDAARR